MLLTAVVLFAAVVQSSDGVPIHYSDQGNLEPALVFVHCWACDRHLWDGQVAAFSGNHRVVAIDLPGHGESGKNRKDWTIPAFGSDVAAVVQKLGLKKVILIGSSMGGPVILEAAKRLGDRVLGLVPVDTLTNVESKTPPEQVEEFLRAFQADYPGAATTFITQYLFVASSSPAVRKRVLGTATSTPPEVAIPVLRAAMTYDPIPALRGIKAPIRAINSDLYPTNLAANRKYAPQFDAVIIPGVGHYPMLETSERFNELLAQAVRDMEKAPR